jgi:predicted nicotinamide N-methyase
MSPKAPTRRTNTRTSAQRRGGSARPPDPREALIVAHTRLTAAPLVPEIQLRLACDPEGLFTALPRSTTDGPEHLPPFWAFAWPGGQATARFILDHPEVVAGRRVLDIGAGSGVAAIASALAGAQSVLAADIDPLSEAAIRLNARNSGVDLATTTQDLIGDPPDADVVLVGDLVYEPELRTRVAAMVESVVRKGAMVLIAERTSARRLRLDGRRRAKSGLPAFAFEPIGDYHAPLTPRLPAQSFERARLWRAMALTASTRSAR